MKTLGIIVGIFVVVLGCGRPDDASAPLAKDDIHPNLYVCETADQLAVRYSTTSFVGLPQMGVSEKTERGGVLLASAMGEGIAVAGEGETALVSVEHYVPDLETTKWTIEIPALTLGSATERVAFASHLTEEVTPTTIAGGNPGEESTRRIRTADCQGSLVAF